MVMFGGTVSNIGPVPHLKAGNILVRQPGYLAEAQGAGTVLGSRFPIILTSRADTVLARMASCAVAFIAARRGDRPVP
jgi:phosphotransacetylase